MNCNVKNKFDKESYLARREEILRKEREGLIKYFEEMTPFNTVDDIPEIPVVDEEVYNGVIVPNLLRCGAIPKEELMDGWTYIGNCRNTHRATWNEGLNTFLYTRYKFGFSQIARVKHFQDEDFKGYDLFVPIKAEGIHPYEKIRQKMEF